MRQHRLDKRLVGRRLILVTAHRRENWGADWPKFDRRLIKLLLQYDDVFVIWPLHANPDVSCCIKEALSHYSGNNSSLICAHLWITLLLYGYRIMHGSY
ncbi:UDP-N-acetylglucosamine 2-epimerase [Escherichia coli]